VKGRLVLAISLILMMSCAKPPAAQTTTTIATAPESRVIFPDGFVVKVEVASDDPTRTQGLMYRDRLADDRGMIFIFPQSGTYAFWMKNCIISLDMIWLDEQRKIVHIAHDVPPCQTDDCPNYPPGASARYVLETAAGVAAKHKLKDGATLRFEGLDRVVVR